MDLLDFFIILLVVALAIRGYAAGFFRQAGSLSGLLLGLIVGAALAPLLARFFGGAQLRAIIAWSVILVAVVAFTGLGEWAGLRVAQLLHRIKLRAIDKFAGAALGVGVGLVAVWLLAAMTMNLPIGGLRQQIHQSAILRALDATLPPAPEVLARFGRIIAPNGFPQVFTGLEPPPQPPVTGPNAAAVNMAASTGRASTVRIEGLGCGGIVGGSGFVAAPSLVATNAHVVAGISNPVVFDGAGPHPATTVWFDPDLDFAVLRVGGLSATPLPLLPGDVPRGTPGAVLGYPGGGPLTVSPAAVLGERVAVGRDIYDQGLVRRTIYELQADVRPGNSGGPVVASQGAVLGVVFAASQVQGGIGYALTSREAAPGLARAATNGAVSTGTCATP